MVRRVVSGAAVTRGKGSEKAPKGAKNKRRKNPRNTSAYEGRTGRSQKAPPARRRGNQLAVRSHRDKHGDEITPTTHPERFTEAGELKWKVAPPKVKVIQNETGEGDWIEKWQSPKTKKWVHNYTVATIEKKAGEKFVQNRAFAAVLPTIRKQVRADLGADGTKEQILALIVDMIDQAYFRIGNEASVADDTYGITTLEKQHMTLKKRSAIFEYVGKKSQDQVRMVTDSKVIRILERLVKRRKRADRIFHIAGEPITAAHVNQYLSRWGVTAKNFRTYHATRLMREGLLALGEVPRAERDEAVHDVVEEVADQLGHTPAVSRGSYIDPMVIDTFMRGNLR